MVTTAPPEQHRVILLPFARLARSCTVAGVEFVPLRDSAGTVTPSLQPAAGALNRILSGYRDEAGTPFTNCVVATISGKGWDLDEDDFTAVDWAASLLFLASWASNEYFARFGGEYVNATNFRVIGQRYTGPLPTYIAISARRRDGHSMDGGYEHGQLAFNLPFQCSVTANSKVDAAFLQTLDAANSAGAATISRLRTALPFVKLANTDDEFMLGPAEAILMGSAFEQLLRADASAYRLTRRFGRLFQRFGSIRVAGALTTRPDILIDPSPSDNFIWRVWRRTLSRLSIPLTGFAGRVDAWLGSRVMAAHLQWWLHRKWIEELYDLRSRVVHRGTEASRKWGWTMFEHLVIAAHVFPLTVKLLLVENGFYNLTDDDRVRCLAVDRLLASTQWVENRGGREDSPDSWASITSKIKHDLDWERAWEAVRRSHPELFSGDAPPPFDAT